MTFSKKDKIVVVSGIPPDNSGTGRMMQRLMSKTRNMDVCIRFVHKARPVEPLRALAKKKNWMVFARVAYPYLLGQVRFYVQIVFLMMFGSGKLLLMHPQTIGFRLTIYLISLWHREQVFIYVLDSSYFCVRSYNHVPGEWASCTRCAGGHFKERSNNKCLPFPIKDKNAGWYTGKLLQFGSEGRINFLSQNKTQMNLIKKHFGQKANVTVVGLWGEDWNEPFEKLKSEDKNYIAKKPIIVFHGFYVAAKGADWFIEIARLCPQFEFFCAHPEPVSLKNVPQNIQFRNVMWTTGLKEIVEEATLVFVPSLWSAPIEGALIKSIVSAVRVATVENDTAFQNEIPDNVILRVSSLPQLAAKQVQQAIDKKWMPENTATVQWLEDFEIKNRDFCDKIVGAIQTR